MNRAFLAIITSFLILFGWQYLFPPPVVQPPVAVESGQQGTAPAGQAITAAPASTTAQQPGIAAPAATVPLASSSTIVIDETARDIVVDTPLYRAVFFEQGGGLKSFILKKYQTRKAQDAPLMELVTTSHPAELPLVFTLDNGAATTLPVFRTDKEHLILDENGKGELIMTATLAGGVKLIRSLRFDGNQYLIASDYTVINPSEIPLQLTPAMVMTNGPFVSDSTTGMYLFNGPAAFINGELEEIKVKKLAKGAMTLQGAVTWAAYEDNYFMCAVIPEQSGTGMVTMSAVGDIVRTVVADGIISLPAGGSDTFHYNAYFGPKKLTILKETGYGLPEVINFGWFDVLAKPMLFLLNFFYTYFGNYGISIILLTCLIKGAFWPITQKGMKSMKNMQKLQPKVAKLKEKFKDDPTKMNQEMMAMYKTYKVNPIGGCLPMIIQIPFFFALYRVLMAAIELRHAPFMFWINDLSAADRLMIGFDIPYLHGIPVLTLLMGGSMYLQQKMTPTTADPTQARIMQFLPIIFTFMFLNFASGLVLYWFINNLLSILQQQLINREKNKA